MNDQQAYIGLGDRQSGNSEFNRMDFVVRSVLNRIATMTLVKVVAVGDDGSVDIQPIVSQLDGAGNAVDHGVIHNVPVWQAQTGVSAIILAPSVGDQGMAIFAQSDISGVKSSRTPGPPGSKRRFDWSDAIYMGGVLNGEPSQYIRVSGSGIELVAPTVTTSGNFSVGTGATGSFSTADGRSVTVVDGVITEII